MDTYLNRRLELMSVNIPRPVGRKRRKVDEGTASVPMVFMLIQHNGKGTQVKALLDSGASETLVFKKPLKGQKVSKQKKVEWETAAGTVSTRGTCDISFTLPEFSSSRTVQHTVHITNKPISTSYDAIIGRDLLHKLSVDIKYSTKSIEWKDQGEIPMKPCASNKENLFL